MHVTFFFRHPRPEYNSIEEVFETVMQAFPASMTFERLELPYTGAGIRAIIGNLIYARRNRGEINHITGDIHYIAIATGYKTVLTIHDTLSVLSGSFVKRFLIRIFWFWLPALYAKKITSISPASALELGKIIPFAKRKIIVVPNPYNPRVLLNNHAEDNSFQSGKSRILLIGTKSNKNLERIVEALSVIDSQLVVLGKLSSVQRNLLNKYKLPYENYFNIPFHKVAALYQHSDLVCFVPTYEGFGMPVLEAQLASRPVVTSNIDPMKWVAGDGACLVDPYSVDSIRRGVMRLLDDDHYRSELVRKGRENVARYEPRVIAAMYCKVYEELVVGSRQWAVGSGQWAVGSGRVVVLLILND